MRSDTDHGVSTPRNAQRDDGGPITDQALWESAHNGEAGSQAGPCASVAHGGAPVPADDGLTLDDIRPLMQRHTAACRAQNDGVCIEQCLDGCDDALDADPDGLYDSTPIDGEAAGDNQYVTAGAARDDNDDCSGHACEGNDARGSLDASADASGGEDALEGVPLLATELLRDPVVLPFAPPLVVLRAEVQGVRLGHVWDAAEAVEVRHRLGEEDTLLRMFLVRMHQSSLLRWARTSGVHWGAMDEAARRVLDKLDSIRASLPGSATFTL